MYLEGNRHFFDKEYVGYILIFVVPIAAFIGLIIGLIVGVVGMFIESRIIYALASALGGGIIGLLSILLLAAAIASIGKTGNDENWLPPASEMFYLAASWLPFLAAAVFPFF